MSSIRTIRKPPREGTNVTLSDARAAFRDLKLAEAKKGFSLPGLGKLMVVNRKARIGGNPATGESIAVPTRKVANFRIDKATKDAILGKK